jgi:hypothetical protein
MQRRPKLAALIAIAKYQDFSHTALAGHCETPYAGPMRKILSALVDLCVFALAASGAIAAYGAGAAWAVLAGLFKRASPLKMANPSAEKAKSTLGFIYKHSGLEPLRLSMSAKVRAWWSALWTFKR